MFGAICSLIVHATVPRVPVGNREVDTELAIETAGIDSELVPAQDHSWGHQVDRYLDTRLRDFEAQRVAWSEDDPMFYQELADVRREIVSKAHDQDS